MLKTLETVERGLAAGENRRSLLKAAAVGLLAAMGLGARSAAAVTCRNSGDCPARPCEVATCAKGNAGNGVGGNTCVYSPRQCSKGRTCVVGNNGRESCRNI
jgi:hypothetical protein